MTPTLVSIAALVDRDGCVLLAQRPAHQTLQGLWEFPGGKVHPDETPERALIRELGEELAIDTHASCLAPLNFASHMYDDIHVVLLLFICRKWNGIPAAQHGQVLRWASMQTLHRFAMPPANAPLIASLRDVL